MNKVDTSNLVNSSVLVTLFGPIGSGKTSLSRTLRGLGTVGLVDTGEGGTSVLKGQDGIVIYEMEKRDSCDDVLKELHECLKAAVEDGVGSIFIDTFTHLEKTVIQILKRDKALLLPKLKTLSLPGFGKASDTMYRAVDMVNAVSRKVPTVIVCHESREKDEATGYIRKMINIRQRGGGNHLNEISSAVLSIDFDLNSGKRVLVCQATPSLLTKSRTPVGVSFPTEIDVGTFEDIGNCLELVIRRLIGE